MPLPFDLPALSRGFAELSATARTAGSEIAAAAAGALAAVVGGEVTVRARAVPGGEPRAGVARLGIELAALPGTAVLEVEPALVASLVDRLAGGPGACVAAALTAVERSALELFALAAIDGACRIAPVEENLAPRLARSAHDPASPLAVELTVTAGTTAGRARLLVPAAAVRAVAPATPADEPAPICIPVSVEAEEVALSADELDLLAPGDVVLLDGPPAPRALVLPGGFALLGRLEEEVFHVEETTMIGRMAEVPVKLAVELARVDVTLAELARLAPGEALPLALDRRGLVTLRLGERELARGELVDVDGAVGVRILAVQVTP
jgi:type III secretion protein Q